MSKNPRGRPKDRVEIIRIDPEKIKVPLARAMMVRSQVAAAAGMSSTSGYRAMAGARTSLKTIGKIARALNVDVSEIIMDSEKAKTFHTSYDLF